MRAVVTAGGRIGGAYAARAGTDVKALAVVRGASMLDRTLDAARALGIEEIAVVGGEPVARACPGVRVVPESADGAENVRRALAAWPDDGVALLYLTSDMPYVTAEALRDFVRRVPQDALAMPLAGATAYERRFVDAPPFGITLAGERVVNGGAFVLPGGAASRVAAVAARMFRARKRPLQMAALVGPRFLARLLLRRLSISDLEARARELLSIPVLAVRDCAPELAFDADGLEEYAYACERG